jgi:hypothetical protein
MTIGTRPPTVKLPSAPNDTTWTLPTSGIDEWFESPAILPPGIEDYELLSRRAANHDAYKINGNKQDWFHYVIFGYYLYDDQTFLIEWRDAKKTKLLLSYFIWYTYYQYRMKSLPMSTELEQWATTHVKEFLKIHDPDAILATTLDFENLESTINNDSRADIEEPWTKIGKTNKKTLTQIHPLQTPPSSPTRNEQTKHKSCMTPTYYSPLQTDDNEDPDEEPLLSQGFSPNTNASDDITMTDIKSPNNPTPTTSPIPQIALTPLIKNTNATKSHQEKNPYITRPGKKAEGVFSYKKRVSMPLLTPTTPIENQNSPIPTTITPAPITDDIQQLSNPTTAEKASPFTHAYKDDHTQISSQSTFQTSNPHTPINDGTQRLTIRWKPANFETLNLDMKEWDIHAAKMIMELFHIFSGKLNAVIWEDKKTDVTSVDSLRSENIRQYLSPKLSSLPSTQTFIFGLRLSAGANTVGNWLTNEHTRTIMTKLKVEVTISNAKCTSGNVVTAGRILFKHPLYTHRLYYLLSLRKKLPENTPFFDIGIHSKMSNGADIPHLVIKCGEHHTQGLSDILASLLDGKKMTAVFVPQPAITSMTEEEMTAMFAAHHSVVTKMHRLSLHPRVVNIDRTRGEKYSSDNILYRTTREWANSLRTPDGKNMRCDAENGGSDRRANLLVPEEYIEYAKMELHKYLHALKAGLYSPKRTPDPNSSNHNDTPQAIYIPSQAVRANLEFLKHFTSAEIWKNAPSSVRQTLPEVFDKKYHRLTPMRQHQPPTSASTNPRTGGGTQKLHPETPGINPHTRQHQHSEAHSNNQANAPLRSDDATIETLASSASRTTSFFSAHTNRFQELEAQIRSNQQAYESANSKIDSIQEQVMKTMEACATSSKQINEMRHKLNECASAQQVIALTNQVQDLATAMTAMFQLRMSHNPQDIHNQTDISDQQGRQDQNETIPNNFHGVKQAAKRPLTQVTPNSIAQLNLPQPPITDSPTEASNNSMIVTLLNDTTTLSTSLSSPEKKKTKTYPHPEDANNHAQELSAQYTSKSTPDDPKV